MKVAKGLIVCIVRYVKRAVLTLEQTFFPTKIGTIIEGYEIPWMKSSVLVL